MSGLQRYEDKYSHILPVQFVNTERHNMYLKKKFYFTEMDAKCEELRNSKKYNRKPLRAYECSFCKGWHLTKKGLHDGTI